MGIAFLIGRIAFVAIFLVSGVTKLMSITATAAAIQAKFTIPAALAAVAASAEGATGMTAYQLLAIVIGVIEILFPLLIIFNIASRFAAVVLLLYTAVVTYFIHDFWNMTGDLRADNMINALKNLSLMGGFLILMVLGTWRPGMHDEDDYPA